MAAVVGSSPITRSRKIRNSKTCSWDFYFSECFGTRIEEKIPTALGIFSERAGRRRWVASPITRSSENQKSPISWGIFLYYYLNISDSLYFSSNSGLSLRKALTQDLVHSIRLRTSLTRGFHWVQSLRSLHRALHALKSLSCSCGTRTWVIRRSVLSRKVFATIFLGIKTRYSFSK